MRRSAFIAGSAASLASLALAPRSAAQRRAEGPFEGREPVDESALDPEERRHVPVLVLPELVRAGRPFDLVVQVGVEPHGMSEGHRVEWIEVALDERRVLLAELGPSIAYPIVRVSLVLTAPARLTARARCNLHETWRTRRPIEVR